MPKQILLADDSITIQKVIALTFAGEDYKITAVDNGSDAIVKAREMRPDIILADVVMPQKNGYEVCETIKNDPQLKTIPVLLLAGTFEPFDEDLAKKAGADGYIIKPFESQAIIQKVKDLISARPATAVTAAPQPAPPKPTVIPSPVTAPAAPKPPVAPPVPVAPPIVRPQPAPVVTPPAAPARPVAAPAPAGEEDFWGTMMEETEEKEAPKKVSPAVSAKAEVAAEQVWEMGGFEEAAPAAEAGEEELWDSFAFEEAEEVEEGFAEEEVPEFEFEEVSPESAEEPLEIASEEFTFGEEIPEVSAMHEVQIEPQPAIIQGYEQTFEPEAISREVPVTPPPSRPLLSAPPVSLSEDQLRAALSQVSREVIEKIVWEVVPDLAEMLIKEEIKRLQGKK